MSGRRPDRDRLRWDAQHPSSNEESRIGRAPSLWTHPQTIRSTESHPSHTRTPCHRLLSAYGNRSLRPGIIGVPPRPVHPHRVAMLWTWRQLRHRGDKPWTADGQPYRVAHAPPTACPHLPTAACGPTRQRHELADVTNSPTPPPCKLSRRSQTTARARRRARIEPHGDPRRRRGESGGPKGRFGQAFELRPGDVSAADRRRECPLRGRRQNTT